MTSPSIFDAYYYSTGCGHLPYERNQAWLAQFDQFAQRIIDLIQPHTVLDAGCALGMLVETLRHRGVEAWGIDISEYAIQNVASDMQPYCQVGSITEPFGRRYDLIVTIEVVEHMPQADSEAAVANLCRHSDDIIFSSSPFDYKEVSHFNVQPPEYWAELFACQGFYRDVDFDASFITPWAARFRRKQEPMPRLVRDYERKFWLLWKENHDMRSLTSEMRSELAEKTQELHALRSQLQPLLERAEAQENNIRGLKNELANVMNSRTWRWGQKVSHLGIGQILRLFKKPG